LVLNPLLPSSHLGGCLPAAPAMADHAEQTRGQQEVRAGFGHRHSFVDDIVGAVDGKTKGQVAGVANLRSDAIRNVTEGHIFHVITQGKGLMMAHGSQVNPDERWKIAKYVKTLQK